MALLDEIRKACAGVAADARSVRIREAAIDPYARELEPPAALRADPAIVPLSASREQLAGFVLTLDAINFGSGWFPTLRKRPGRSGYFTIALGLRERFDADPDSFAAARLGEIDAAWLAEALGQAPDHELIGLYTAALRELGAHVCERHAGSFERLVDQAGGSAERLVEMLSGWPDFRDVSTYGDITVPFFKRAQIAAADLARAGVLAAGDQRRLTIFADNLVPHVLRVDGVLEYDAALLARIEAGELLRHGSFEEVEIRACAVHAVELLVAAKDGRFTAAAADAALWDRGSTQRYKASPRHRTRCTAY
jgi:hypothetical protein